MKLIFATPLRHRRHTLSLPTEKAPDSATSEQRWPDARRMPGFLEKKMKWV